MTAISQPESGIERTLFYGLQPALMVGVLTFWYFNREIPSVYPLAILAVQVILGVLEHRYPARRDWVQFWKEKSVLILLVIVLASATVTVGVWYDTVLAEPLAVLRAAAGLDIWPHTWPIMAQLFLVFFASEFIWYWFHRAEHRWSLVWKASGHGAHHSFKHLGAINFGANHPFEIFLLVLPAALVELLFGVGIAAAGSAVLTSTLASIAHANIRMNTRWIGFLFTTNRYHIRHHSAVLEESNTNYGCSAIIWDRLFGTFGDSEVVDSGIGPTEPTMWEKFLMPFREPRDSEIAPGGRVEEAS